MSCSRRACPAEPCRTDGDPGSLRPSRATPLPSLARGTGRHRERPVTAGGRQRPFERPSGCASGTPAIPPPFSDTAATEIWQALRRSLSPNARLILRVLDEDGAAFTRLLRHYGGQSLRIPRRLPPEEHALRRTLGTDCLRRLMATFGGTVIYVPRCRLLLAAVRRIRLVRQFSRHTAAGASGCAAVRQLARQEGLSERRIWQILKTSDDLPEAAAALPGLLPEQGDT
ncbi:MAG TPA: hypothetical protein H9774_12600 [Candidatus Desulfovibrio gallistercoris]|nr:hypothetical protein [Candidatus Desulfovibrio gallistercoris]